MDTKKELRQSRIHPTYGDLRSVGFPYDLLNLSGLTPDFIRYMSMFYCKSLCKMECLSSDRKSFGHEHWQNHLDELIHPAQHIQALIYEHVRNFNNDSYDFKDILLILNIINNILSMFIAVRRGGGGGGK